MACPAACSVLCLLAALIPGYVHGNTPPLVSFGQNGGNVILYENQAKGSSIFDITARDTDSPSLTFAARNDETKNLVIVGQPTQINPAAGLWSATVYLNASLDRDNSPNKRDLYFTVSDGTNEINGRVQMIIRDVNDNPPTFTRPSYRISLPEGTIYVNTTVFTVTVTDPDDGPGGSPEFFMTANAQGADQEYKKTFVIPEKYKYMGNIELTKELDYETRNYYQYQISAKDRGSPPCPGPGCLCSNITEPQVTCAGVPASFIVIVTDVQDSPPYFERLPYFTTVAEGTQMGDTIYKVSALDGDRGIPNDVTYSIVNATASDPFAMNTKTGEITVNTPNLDADVENGQRYELIIKASEVTKANQTQKGETTTTTLMTITVTDINDNAPMFDNNVYYATVQENTPQGVPLTFNGTVKVSDIDQSINSQFSLSVEREGAPYSVFATLPGSTVVVQSATTVMVSVNNASVLDYETTKNITFQIRATEVATSEKRNSTATVIVTIEDMNDNSPVFASNQSTQVDVTEHAANGTVLATFTATDLDSGDYGNVSYSLEDSQNGKFSIGSQTGELIVTADIDREALGGSAYVLVVIATDNMAGAPAQRRQTRLNVHVTVTDVNDHAPAFQPHPQSVTVQENAQVKTTLMTLTATDKDEGLNGKVYYQVESVQSLSPHSKDHLFGVQPNSGVVYVNDSLIGHPGTYNVTFVAFDSAVNDSRNSTSVVVVNVRDVNINAPRFVVPDESLANATLRLVPNITVDEEQDIGTELLKLNATDVDTGDNGLVFYFLEPDLSGAFQSFDVNYKTGVLTNKLKLDREQTELGYLQIELKAEDQGAPTKLKTVVPLRVYLRDVDDNPPLFPRDSPELSLHVGEERSNVMVGLVNVSVDADSDPANRITCYYLYGGEQVDDFSLAKDTGELRLLTVLDRDITPRLDLVVKATANCSLAPDHFTKAGTGNYSEDDRTLLKVVVVVDDINDNPPVFVKEALTVGLVYDKEINSAVINLATYTLDNDTALHSKNKYRLLDTKVSGEVQKPPPAPFKLAPNGTVLTNRIFAADEKGYFILSLLAYDDDNQNDTADLKIYLVGDRERVKLVFNLRPNDVQNMKGDLVTKLSEALGMTVVADKIASHISSGGTANSDRTDVFIHARYIPSGEIVPPGELLRSFDYNEKVRAVFQEFGASETLPVWQEADEGDDESIRRAFIIVAIVLGIVCVALLFVLFNTVRRYRRRLRAATTSAFVIQKDEPSGYVPPGTNKYFAAENPLFGKDVKPHDPDRIPGDNDSLDDNAVDVTAAGGKLHNQVSREKMFVMKTFKMGNDFNDHDEGYHGGHGLQCSDI